VITVSDKTIAFRVSDDFHAEVKMQAFSEKKSLQAYIIDVLARDLERKKAVTTGEFSRENLEAAWKWANVEGLMDGIPYELDPHELATRMEIVYMMFKLIGKQKKE